jgi:hypothetical protein
VNVSRLSICGGRWDVLPLLLHFVVAYVLYMLSSLISAWNTEALSQARTSNIAIIDFGSRTIVRQHIRADGAAFMQQECGGIATIGSRREGDLWRSYGVRTFVLLRMCVQPCGFVTAYSRFPPTATSIHSTHTSATNIMSSKTCTMDVPSCNPLRPHVEDYHSSSDSDAEILTTRPNVGLPVNVATKRSKEVNFKLNEVSGHQHYQGSASETKAETVSIFNDAQSTSNVSRNSKDSGFYSGSHASQPYIVTPFPEEPAPVRRAASVRQSKINATEEDTHLHVDSSHPLKFDFDGGMLVRVVPGDGGMTDIIVSDTRRDRDKVPKGKSSRKMSQRSGSPTRRSNRGSVDRAIDVCLVPNCQTCTNNALPRHGTMAMRGSVTETRAQRTRYRSPSVDSMRRRLSDYEDNPNRNFPPQGTWPGSQCSYEQTNPFAQSHLFEHQGFQSPPYVPYPAYPLPNSMRRPPAGYSIPPYQPVPARHAATPPAPRTSLRASDKPFSQPYSQGPLQLHHKRRAKSSGRDCRRYDAIVPKEMTSDDSSESDSMDDVVTDDEQTDSDSMIRRRRRPGRREVGRSRVRQASGVLSRSRGSTSRDMGDAKPVVIDLPTIKKHVPTELARSVHVSKERAEHKDEFPGRHHLLPLSERQVEQLKRAETGMTGYSTSKASERITIGAYSDLSAELGQKLAVIRMNNEKQEEYEEKKRQESPEPITVSEKLPNPQPTPSVAKKDVKANLQLFEEVRPELVARDPSTRTESNETGGSSTHEPQLSNISESGRVPGTHHMNESQAKIHAQPSMSTVDASMPTDESGASKTLAHNTKDIVKGEEGLITLTVPIGTESLPTWCTPRSLPASLKILSQPEDPGDSSAPDWRDEEEQSCNTLESCNTLDGASEQALEECDISEDNVLNSAMGVIKSLLLAELLEYALCEASDAPQEPGSSSSGSQPESVNNPASSNLSPCRTVFHNLQRKKRTRHNGRDPDDGSGSSSDNDDRPKKKPDRSPPDCRRLKCPFYQRQPEMYTKAACVRCWLEMPSEPARLEHLQQDNRCKRIPEPHDNRIHPHVLKQLNFKKAPYAYAKTAHEKWELLYKELFPGETEIPSPCKSTGV